MKTWLKYIAVAILIYVHVGGLLFTVPRLSILNETVRALYFHVPMWFGQMGLLTLSLVFSIAYLRTQKLKYDIYAAEFAKTGIIFGVLGLVTGSIWAKYTWGEFWSNDPKQMAAAIAVLIYLAYIVLRGSMTDLDKRARVSGVYNIFAFFIYIPLIMILPRLVQSLHPGGMEGAQGGGNPALGGGSLDGTMRMIFWPAVLGWLLLGIWISTLKIRLSLLANKNLINE